MEEWEQGAGEAVMPENSCCGFYYSSVLPTLLGPVAPCAFLPHNGSYRDEQLGSPLGGSPAASRS